MFSEILRLFLAKITVFYIAYFAFLAGLFTASIQLMQSQLPEDKPKLNTRLNIPGLHFFPKFDRICGKSRIGPRNLGKSNMAKTAMLEIPKLRFSPQWKITHSCAQWKKEVGDLRLN